MEPDASASYPIKNILSGLLVLCLICLTDLYSYLLFHSIAEILSIVIAAGIFMIAWNSREFMDNSYLTLVGIGFLFIAGIYLLHTLAYEGMGIFQGYDANLATQLWISAQYMESITLFIAPLLMAKKIKPYKIFYTYLFLSILLLASIFYWNIFPDCFVEGTGLTLFKKVSEYIISFILLGALYLLFQKRDDCEPSIFKLISFAIILTICSEAVFTFYISAYGFSNLMGHILKIMAFFLFYKAFISTGFKTPHDLMFKEMKEKEKHRKLVSNISDVIAILDENGITRYISPNIIEQFGWKPDDIIGKYSLLRVYPDDRERIKKELNRIFKSDNKRVNMEFRYLCKDGGFTPVELTAVNMANDPIIKGVLINYKDISDRRKAEDAVRKSEEKFKTIFRTSPDAIILTRVEDGVFIDINEGFKRITGYAPEDIIGKSVIEINIWHDLKDREVLISGLKKNGVVENLEVELIGKDKQIRTGLMSASLLRIGNQDVILSVVRDITSFKAKDRKLLESERRYRSMMKAMDDAAYICSSEYRLEYINPAMVKWIGRDATGELCYKSIYGLDEKCSWCISGKVKNAGHMKYEVTNPKNDRLYHISASPVTHADGTISILSILRDITEIKIMEARIQQSQRMEAIGTLAGGIAHDFNNILFPIVGHTEMLLEDVPEDSPLRNSLKAIYTSAMRAGELVKQILTFSRQDKKELKLMKVQPIIKEALKLLRSSIPATIDIKQNIQADCGAVKADPTQIHQVIMNLSVNAYHAMEKKGGKLTVTLKEIQLDGTDKAAVISDLKPGIYACLIVSDTGIGMDKHLIKKIFDPFFTTKEKGKGTGMGLSVVHGIVKEMGGTIRVYSELDTGTEFRVYLPVVKDLPENQVISTNNTIQRGSENILIVDDEKTILTMEKQMLEHLGYHVAARSSSFDALEAFRADPRYFDLVITDLAMPNMPGDMLAAELIKIRPDIPILLCTGFSEALSEEQAALAGIKGFLLKPIIRNDLAGKIREMLE